MAPMGHFPPARIGAITNYAQREKGDRSAFQGPSSHLKHFWKGGVHIGCLCVHEPLFHQILVPLLHRPDDGQRDRAGVLLRAAGHDFLRRLGLLDSVSPILQDGELVFSQEEGGGGLPPAACHYLPHLYRGPWKKNGVRKIPLAPFYPPYFARGQPRDQRNVDSMSTAVRSTARGLLYGQEQMAVAQVDLRLVSAVARPPYYAPTTTTTNHHSLGRSYKSRDAVGWAFPARLLCLAYS